MNAVGRGWHANLECGRLPPSPGGGLPPRRDVESSAAAFDLGRVASPARTERQQAATLPIPLRIDPLPLGVRVFAPSGGPPDVFSGTAGQSGHPGGRAMWKRRGRTVVRAWWVVSAPTFFAGVPIALAGMALESLPTMLAGIALCVPMLLGIYLASGAILLAIPVVVVRDVRRVFLDGRARRGARERNHSPMQ